MRRALTLQAIRWQQVHGLPDPGVVSPGTVHSRQSLTDSHIHNEVGDIPRCPRKDTAMTESRRDQSLLVPEWGGQRDLDRPRRDADLVPPTGRMFIPFHT